MDTYPLKNSQKEKKVQFIGKSFQKDNFNDYEEIEICIYSLGEILYRRKTYEYKNKQRIPYWINECKTVL